MFYSTETFEPRVTDFRAMIRSLPEPIPFYNYFFLRDGRFVTFTESELIAALRGKWMPDFLDDFHRWVTITLFKHGLIKEIYRVPKPEFKEYRHVIN